MAVLDPDRVGLHAQTGGVEGKAGLQVKFPLVPGALENFAFALEFERANLGTSDVGTEPTPTEWSAFVWTDVADGVKGAIHIEDSDPSTAADAEDLPAPRRDFVGTAKHTAAVNDRQRPLVLDRFGDRDRPKCAHRPLFR